MATKNRLDKLEQITRPDKINNWNPPIVEIISGHEKDPDHIAKLDAIKAEARAAGWTEGAGPCLVEVILHDK